MNKLSPFWKSTRLILIMLLGLIIYSFGFQVTKVNLSEFRRESRQESRIRVTRALFNPDILEYEQEEFISFAPIQVPCQEGEQIIRERNANDPYLVFTPTCANAGDEIQIEGFNFEPNTAGPISFIPSSDPEYEIALQLSRIDVDSQGHFLATAELPQRTSDDQQFIRATVRRNIGLPVFSDNAIATWEKIVETVFMALLATSLGLAFSIPISFFAARNLMREVKSPLASIGLSLLGWPLGLGVGFYFANLLGNYSSLFTTSLSINIVALIFSSLIVWATIRWVVSQSKEDKQQHTSIRLMRFLGQLASAIFAVLTINLLATLIIALGDSFGEKLGSFAFLADFAFQIGDIIKVVSPTVFAIASGAAVGSLTARLGQRITERSSSSTVRTINLVVSTVAGAALFITIGAAIDWLYQVNNPALTFWGPGIVGGTLGLILAIRTKAKEPVAVGMVIYYLTRGVLNATRSVEPLIMVIVAVVWVGIGSFAGVIALGLHTIAALSKLYSEQIESINPGPLEAIQATGANRLQVIIYGVIPQIIPPYIAFTMYRWDINVRMSTIIGFAGGGGIGSLLFQNLNLLNYNAVSTQMLAIAIVVASMDFTSSILRERYV